MKRISILALASALLCSPAISQTNPGTSPLSVVKGGTGGTTAAAARTNLGFAATANRLYGTDGSGVSAVIPMPAAGLTLSGGTLSFANDLAALEGLSGTGIARRTGTDAWSVGTAVANSELATMGAYTLKGNATGSSATPTDVDIAALTSKASPASTDYILLSDQAASGALKKALVSSIASAGSVSSIAGNTGAFTLDRGVTNSTNAIRLDVPVFYGFLGGLTISTSAGSAQFSVSVGGATDSTAVDFLKLTSSITKTTSSWAVGSGNGALDTGTIATNTWYYVYVIKRLDTGVVDVLVSTSKTSPTLPTNYTLFRRIGALRTTTGIIWRDIVQNGDYFYYVTPVQDINSSSIASTRNLLTLTAPPDMRALTRIYVFNTGAPVAFIVQPPAETDRATGSYLSLVAETTNQGAAGHFETLLNGSSQIALRASASSSSATIETLGWVDTRGR